VPRDTLGSGFPLKSVLGNWASGVDEVGCSGANEGGTLVDPTNMSGDVERGNNNYPEWTKEQLLLLLIWNKLQEAYDSGESELRVSISRGGDDTGVRLAYSTMAINVSDEIPELKRGGEAVAVFESLRQGGYFYGDFPRVPKRPRLLSSIALALEQLG
jgi:hypothetical protein